MYKIIGVDQKEYGPISSEQLKQWIAEGRANAQTRVMLEGQTQWQPLATVAEFSTVLAAAKRSTPPPVIPSVPSPTTDDTLSTIIPYKNPKALIAYYCGVFSIIPCFGIILGIIGVVLGMQGLRFANSQPGGKGKVHAWIGIICGGIFGTLWIIGLIGMIFAANIH